MYFGSKEKVGAFSTWCFITSISFQEILVFELMKFTLWAALLLSMLLHNPKDVIKFLLFSLIFFWGLLGVFIEGDNALHRVAVFASAFMAFSSMMFLSKTTISLRHYSMLFILGITCFKIIIFTRDVQLAKIAFLGFDRPDLYAGDANYNAIIGLFFLTLSTLYRSVIIGICGAIMLVLSLSKSLILVAPIFFMTIIYVPSFIIYTTGFSAFIYSLFYFKNINTLNYRGFLLDLGIANYDVVILPVWGNFRKLTEEMYYEYSTHSHNSFVTIFYDFGIIIATIFIFYVYRSLNSIDSCNVSSFTRTLCITSLAYLFTNDFTHSIFLYLVFLGVNQRVADA